MTTTTTHSQADLDRAIEKHGITIRQMIPGRSEHYGDPDQIQVCIDGRAKWVTSTEIENAAAQPDTGDGLTLIYASIAQVAWNFKRQKWPFSDNE